MNVAVPEVPALGLWEKVYLVLLLWLRSLVSTEQYPVLTSLAPQQLGHHYGPDLPQSLEARKILLSELPGYIISVPCFN